MGEIADQLINGDMCEQCGEYLGGGDGFPRLCLGCSGVKTGRINSKKPNKSKPITTGANAIRGVKNYLAKMKLPEGVTFEFILGEYSYHIGMADVALNDPIGEVIQSICEEIQKDFGKFVKWFKESYKNENNKEITINRYRENS